MVKVIVMGIDGGTWSVIAPLISKGVLPNFKKVVAEGMTGILHSTIPGVTPPAWTSIFTGVNPGKHGIVDFYMREKTGFVSCSSRYRMCKTIWDILSETGRHCVVIGDPVTFPPQKINGVMTTGLLTPHGSTNWVYPEGLRKELDIVARGFEADIPPNFPEIALKDKAEAIDMLANLTRKLYRVSEHLVREFEWDVLAAIYTTTDRLQHYYWSDVESISDHYQILDTILGEYLKFAKDFGADVIVVSDHGFGSLTWSFPINEWLERNGLAVLSTPTPNRTRSAWDVRSFVRGMFARWLSRDRFAMLPPWLQDIARKYFTSDNEGPRVDTSKSQVYAMTSSGVFVQNEDLVLSTAEKLRHAVNEETGELAFERVVQRQEVLWGDYASRAPDIFLLSTPGSIPETKRRQYTNMTGTHRPEGIFVHYRPGARSRLSRVDVNPWDVAATILSLQGVKIPGYFDGEPKLGDFSEN